MSLNKDKSEIIHHVLNQLLYEEKINYFETDIIQNVTSFVEDYISEAVSNPTGLTEKLENIKRKSLEDLIKEAQICNNNPLTIQKEIDLTIN